MPIPAILGRNGSLQIKAILFTISTTPQLRLKKFIYLYSVAGCKFIVDLACLYGGFFADADGALRACYESDRHGRTENSGK
jgi:hypothetical protein